MVVCVCVSVDAVVWVFVHARSGFSAWGWSCMALVPWDGSALNVSCGLEVKSLGVRCAFAVLFSCVVTLFPPPSLRLSLNLLSMQCWTRPTAHVTPDKSFAFSGSP